MLTSTALDISDDIEKVYAHFEAQGWGDGHPIVPPSYERVRRFLGSIDIDPRTRVAVLEPSRGVATVEKIAINSVMAGCIPDHFPVVIAAIKAVASNPRHASAMGMAHSLSPLLVVNGPVVSRLKIESGAGGSANSWRSNAAIGRAVRLCLLNISGVVGSTDNNTFMWLPKYMYCVAETQENNPWSSFSSDKGCNAEESSVAVFWKEPAHHIEVNWPASVQELLAAFCDSMCTVASHASYGTGQKVLLGLCPDHARMCSQAGFTKSDVKRFIFEHARKPLRAYGSSAPAHFPVEWKKFYTWGPDAMVPMVASADEIEIIVTGGAGANSLFFPYGYGPFIELIEPLKARPSSDQDTTNAQEDVPNHRVLSPRAEDFDARARDRPDQLSSSNNGCSTLALIDNGRPNADVLIEEVGRLLAGPKIRVENIAKAALGLHVGDPLPEDVLQSLTAKVTGGLIAVGSCGSCTARSVRDAADFYSSGKRIAVLVAPAFERQARALAKSFRLPLELIIPLPIGGLSPDAADSAPELRAAVVRLLPEIERAING